MGRRPRKIGTYGEIRAKLIGPKTWEARARFRCADGTMKRPRRVGPTRGAAVDALRDALAALADEALGGQISGDSRFAVVAELWHAELVRDAALGTRSPNTVRGYRGYLDNWVLPAIGELRMRGELATMSLQGVVDRARDKRGFETAKSIRAVVSGVCAYAVRHGAIGVNPAKGIRLAAAPGDGKVVRGLDAEQRADLDAKLRQLAADRRTDRQGRSLGKRSRVWTDLPDLKDAMLATGVRLGELLALSAEEVDPAARTVTVAWHVIRVPGHGLERRPLRKGNKPDLVLRVPEWSVPMWRRRKLASGGGPLWPSWNGEWMDPSNIIHRVREAFDECGYEWVTSHVFRKTVASVLDEAGLPIGDVADQLGNTRAVAEKHYVGRKVANDRTAAALESITKEAN